MSTSIHERHNVSVLLCTTRSAPPRPAAPCSARPWTRPCGTAAWSSPPAMRRIEYEITFVEISTDADHEHFLVRAYALAVSRPNSAADTASDRL